MGKNRILRAARVLSILACLAGATALWAQTPPQPTGLQVRFHSGQSFITWTERGDLSGEHYRVYRHATPITAGNLGSATRLYEVAEGSGRFLCNRYPGDAGQWHHRFVERYVIVDQGTPIGAGTGLLVWTLATADFGGGTSGNGYYAVTTVSAAGTENTADFTAANAAGPLAELVADPLPVEISPALVSIGPGGHAFIQYMDLRNWNPTFHAPNTFNAYFGLDPADPAVAGAIQYAYDYWIYEPDAYCGGNVPVQAPLTFSLHGWNDNGYPPPNPTDPADPWWCNWKIYPVDTNQTWYLGFAKNCDYRLGSEPSAGDTVVNYTEQRILRMVYDLLRHPVHGPRIDPDRLFVYGHSMGASGTLALALRYPNVFAAAYSSEPMTNYRASGDGGGTDWRGDCAIKWGAVSLNLPVQIRGPGNWATHLQRFDGTGVWDWQNHQAAFASRRDDPMVPLGFAHGTADTVIEWPTQGQPAYGAADGGMRCWGGAVTDADHTWLSFQGLPPTLGSNQDGNPFWNFNARKSETVPGLSRASGDSPFPPTGPGGYNQTLEWSSSWDSWDGAPMDTPTQWRMSLRTTDGSSQTVDVTPRRLQHFALSPGSYTWENRRASDDGLVAQGTVTVGSDGLATVPGFSVTPGGNRLYLRSGGGGCSLSCAATVPTTGTSGIPVSFASTATPAGCSGSPTYDWDFGDGTAHSAAQNASHTYASAGTFSWTLTVHADTQVCTRSGSITISGSPTCTLACSATVPASGNTCTAVSFAATATPSNCTGAPSFAWTFGDGATATSQNSSHTYAAAGTFTWNMSATVQDVTCTRTGTITITVPGGARPWPDTSASIRVFNDQLATWNMSDAQFLFAASHYAGCQKVTRDAARRLRETSPDFLVLHYRLGQALGFRSAADACAPTGDFLQIIDGDDWVQEWPGDSAVQEAWFFHYSSQRVYSCIDGHYLMNLDDAGWRSWWSAQVIAQLQDNENDGLFADSFGVPNYFGACTFNPCLPDIDAAFENAWAASEFDFTNYIQGRFAGQWKWLPNIGALINSRDPSDHSSIDGGMVENFAEWGGGSYFDEGDWVLQMNRLLPLAAAGKIMILQSYPDAASVQERLFCLGSYLLAKGARTYINLETNEEPEWYPEYGVGLDAATDPLPADISTFLDPTTNCYRRNFASGFVLVNPSDTPRTANLGGTFNLVVPSGGGIVPENGAPPGSLAFTPVTSTTVPAHGAAILMSTAPPACTLTCTATVAPTGTTGSPVSFASTATPSNCTGAVSYAWTFGDGATSTEQNPSHSYASMGDYAWTMTTTVQGVICSKTGSITMTNTGGLPGDCDVSGTVSIGEVQKAINMFLGTLAPGCGVDCNTNGVVSIGEVQKVINAFLGLANSC
jgi:PKD repeat protein/poly(3-hydroxybutyrate) depolymerase